MLKPYYAIEQEGKTAAVTIYGDITSWPWMDSDVSAFRLSNRLAELDADTIDVYINSYGGEVAEGLAIHSALLRHPAKIVTHCDGFACSAASVVFMAGDERMMGRASLLMIHNAWTSATGNAAQLREEADNLDKISHAAANAYRSRVNIPEDELQKLLDNESWIEPEEAVSMGFATAIEGTEAAAAPAACARAAAFARMTAKNPARKSEPENFMEYIRRE